MSKEIPRRTSVDIDDPQVKSIMKKFPGVSAARVIEVLASNGAKYFANNEQALKDALLGA